MNTRFVSPTVRIQTNTLIAQGAWRIHTMAKPNVLAVMKALEKQGRLCAQTQAWDLSGVTDMDHMGAQWFWNLWGKTLPKQLRLSPQYQHFFARLASVPCIITTAPPVQEAWRNKVLLIRGAAWQAALQFKCALWEHMASFIALLGQLMLDMTRCACHPRRAPWKEISAHIYHTGFQALGITALVAFLIGIVLSFLCAQQLRAFGGEIYLINILGMSIIRELGPLLAAILVAGRSGSAITAQLGVMRVTEELDAMSVMGLSHHFRLVLPRVIALCITMSLLVTWTNLIALIGGMITAYFQLNLSIMAFIEKLPNAVPLTNYWISLGKGVVFGGLIALVACHFGLRISPNTASLGRGTTASVVTAITMVIVTDALFAVVFSHVGF